MVTIKKRARKLLNFSIGILLISALAGCADRGARALLDGEKLIAEGKYPEAIARLTQAADRLPQNAQAWNHLGVAYHHAGDAAKAIEAYEHALRLDRNLSVARYNLGSLYLEQNNFTKATDEFVTYTKLEPKQLDGWLKLGTAEMRQAAVLTGVDKSKWLEAAKKTFEHSIDVALTAEAYNSMGVIETQRDHYRDAGRCFNSALQKEKNYAPALLNLAILNHHYLNDRRAALQKYREFLAVQPRSSRFRQVEEIARQLDLELTGGPVVPTNTSTASVSQPAIASRPANNLPSTKTSPKEAKSEVRKPVLFAQGGDSSRKEAIPAITPSKNIKSSPIPESVKETPPPQPSVSRYQYRSPAKPGPGNREQAMPFFTEGSDAQRRHNSRKAFENFQQAVKLDPGFFDAYFKLGLASYELGDYAACLSAYETALALSSESTAARYNFALALQKSNYPQDAANELKKVLEQNPNEVRAHLTLANLYVQLQQKSMARPHYAKVLELEPRHPEALAIRYWLSQNPG